MISVEEALALVFALVTPLADRNRPPCPRQWPRYACPAVAKRDQPPFAASAMDGYAINGDAVPGEHLHRHRRGRRRPCVRWHAWPRPSHPHFHRRAGARRGTRVIIQEDVDAADGHITLRDNLDAGNQYPPLGQDFRIGDSLPPRLLRPNDLALLAAMNVAEVAVTRRPVVAIIATGDELVMPGEVPRPDQIIASNSFALKAMVEDAGGIGRMLPIARDTEAALRTVLGTGAGCRSDRHHRRRIGGRP